MNTCPRKASGLRTRAGVRRPGESFSRQSNSPKDRRHTDPGQNLRPPRLLPIWSDDRKHFQGWEVAR